MTGTLRTTTCSQLLLRTRRRANSRQSDKTRQALRILVLDDSPGVRQLIAAILRSDGHIVELVGSVGDAALQLQRARYELLISDLAAEELAEAVRQRWPHMRCILASGSLDELTPDWDAHLAKPFTPNQLRELVELVGVGE